MVIPMNVIQRKTGHPATHSLLIICLTVACVLLTSTALPAQAPEAGSATVEEMKQTDVDLPADSTSEDANSEEEKKDERPRELGVMILVVWILAGAGIGILIFTSLFGHSVRTMIRRPYPPQSHARHLPPTEESESETEDESATVEKDPPQS